MRWYFKASPIKLEYIVDTAVILKMHEITQGLLKKVVSYLWYTYSVIRRISTRATKMEFPSSYQPETKDIGQAAVFTDEQSTLRHTHTHTPCYPIDGEVPSSRAHPHPVTFLRCLGLLLIKDNKNVFGFGLWITNALGSSYFSCY